MAIAAFIIGYEALITMKKYPSHSPGMIAFVGAAFSIVFKEILFHYTHAVGQRVKSPAVIANAWHHRSDSFSSIPVALAVIVAVIVLAIILLIHELGCKSCNVGMKAKPKKKAKKKK